MRSVELSLPILVQHATRDQSGCIILDEIFLAQQLLTESVKACRNTAMLHTLRITFTVKLI